MITHTYMCVFDIKALSQVNGHAPEYVCHGFNCWFKREREKEYCLLCECQCVRVYISTGLYNMKYLECARIRTNTTPARKTCVSGSNFFPPGQPFAFPRLIPFPFPSLPRCFVLGLLIFFTSGDLQKQCVSAMATSDSKTCLPAKFVRSRQRAAALFVFEEFIMGSSPGPPDQLNA